MKKLFEKISNELVLRIGFAVSIGILFMASFFSYETNKALISNAQWVDHTNLVIRKLNGMLITIKDAQLSQKNFLMTNDEKYLGAYFTARDKFNDDLDVFKSITKDNATQQERAKELDVLLASYFDKMDGLISMKQSQTFIYDPLSGKKELDEMVALLLNMRAVEMDLLNIRIKKFDDSSANAPSLIILFSIIALGFAIISYVVVNSNIKEIRKKEAGIQEAYEEVQTINEELTATNEELRALNEELHESRHGINIANEKLLQSQEEMLINNDELKESLFKTNKYRTELEAFKNRLIEAQEIANVGNWEWDIETNNIYWSDQLIKMFDHKPLSGEKFDYETYLTLIHPDDKNTVSNAVEKIMKDYQPYTIEHRLLKKDSRLSWILAKGKVILSEDGKLLKLAGTSLDITELKETQQELQHINEELSGAVEELRQAEENLVLINRDLESMVAERGKELVVSEERFRIISLATNDAIWDWNLQTDKLWWNEGFKIMFGYQTEQIEPGIESLRNRIHPEDKDRIINEIRKFLISGKSQWKAEYRFLKSSGDYIDVMERGYVIYNDLGKPYRMLGSLINITERKELENQRIKLHEQAEEQRKRLYKLLMNVPAAITIMKGRDYIYEVANDQYKSLVGTDEDIIGKSRRRMNWGEESDKVIQLMDEIYKTGKPFFRTEFPANVTRNGRHEKAYFNLLLEPIFDSNHEIEGIMTFGLEVTEQVLARMSVEESAQRLRMTANDLNKKNQELVKINELLDTFVYTAAHDLKSPVINLKGLFTLIKETEDLATKEEYFNTIDIAVKRLDDTINGLVEVIDVQSEDNKIAKETSFEDSLEVVMEEFRPALNTIGGHINFDFKQRPNLVYLKSYVSSIFTNLIGNAIKYRSENKPLEVKITTYSLEDYIVLEVKDNGIGIDLEKNGNKIFKAFNRFSRNAEGKGLGLYLIKTMVERNGGKLEVESSLNAGTTFKVFLKEYI